MIINNYNQIKSLLVFKPGIYYYLQVLQRRKDNPGITKDSKLFSHFVTTPENFEISFQQAKSIADIFHARVYISIIPRSIEALGKRMGKVILDRVCSGQYGAIYALSDEIALYKETIKWKGTLTSSRYMLDIDSINDLGEIIKNLEKQRIPILAKIPTLHGMHLVIPGIYPEGLWKDNIERKGDDFTFKDSGATFTYRPDSNTILYLNV